MYCVWFNSSSCTNHVLHVNIKSTRLLFLFCAMFFVFFVWILILPWYLNRIIIYFRLTVTIDKHTRQGTLMKSVSVNHFSSTLLNWRSSYFWIGMSSCLSAIIFMQIAKFLTCLLFGFWNSLTTQLLISRLEAKPSN